MPDQRRYASTVTGMSVSDGSPIRHVDCRSPFRYVWLRSGMLVPDQTCRSSIRHVGLSIRHVGLRLDMLVSDGSPIGLQ